MKKLFLISLFLLTATYARTQTSYIVPAMLGTQNVACTNITTSAVGYYSIGVDCSEHPFADGYTEGNSGGVIASYLGPGTITWTFDPGVEKVIIPDMEGVTPGDLVAIMVNSVPTTGIVTSVYPVSTSCGASGTAGTTTTPYPAIVCSPPTFGLTENCTISFTAPPGSSADELIHTFSITDNGIIADASGEYCEGVNHTLSIVPGASLSGGITGWSPMCIGSSYTFTDGTTGGVWSSSSPTVAAIAPSTGIVTALTAGTTNITYTFGICADVLPVTVAGMTYPIAGPTSVCAGGTITLTDPSGSGTWSSSNTSVATAGTSSGIIYGITPGITAITFTSATAGCSVESIITVLPLPASITGPTAVCMGSTITLTDASTGGTWSSSNISIATVDLSTGIVTGVSSGAATITYTMPGGGCYVTKSITVNLSPVSISGPTSVCLGSTTSLTDATTGGTWTSSYTAIASIGSAGTVTGVATGIAEITYTLSDGCIATSIMTVIPTPASISGVSSLCVMGTITLTNATTGGTWISGSTSTATVGSGTGIVTGVAGGITTITYSMPGSGCYTTAVVTVDAPSPISGPAIVAACIGATITLTDGDSGGTWSSSNTAAAIVGSSSGIVTGVAVGITTISYSVPGSSCIMTLQLTVDALPTTISGGGVAVCPYIVTTLTESVTGGAWSSSNSLIASVDASGHVTGYINGSVTISYTMPCGSYATTTITIDPPAPIGGPSVVCAGSTITLTDATTGGTWSSGDLSEASINITSGVLTGGTTSGTVIITYTAPSGCYTLSPVIVNPTPAITGTTSFCIGSTTVLSDADPLGTWSSGNTAIAAVTDLGGGYADITGVAAGNATITYVMSTGCMVTTVVTVAPGPDPILGSPTVCLGTTAAFYDLSGSGTWSSSNTTIGTIDASTGTFYPVSAGTVTIAYSVPPGCAATFPVTVLPLPPSITGPMSECVGDYITLSDAATGGYWIDDPPGIAIAITYTGQVVGVAPGTTTITYHLPDGCTSSVVFTVHPLPAPISGPAYICSTGATILYTDATIGGAWSSSNTAIATVDPSGNVYSVAYGVVVISYTGGDGCSSILPIYINATPTITLPLSVCLGGTASLSDMIPGGTWASGNTSIATINSTTGVVTGVATGTTPVTYTAGGCSATGVLTVNPMPAAISGGGAFCGGTTLWLTDATTGGTWSSSNTTLATVDPFSGIVTGVSGGIATITYATPVGCDAVTTVTVDAQPAPITGSDIICQYGSPTTLTDATTGGEWISSNTVVATVGSSTGIVTGGYTGTALISYIAAGCAATVTVTVITAPAPIVGPYGTCLGETLDLFCPTPGGTWSSSNSLIASTNIPVGLNDPVTGVAVGMVTITYDVGGCIGTYPFGVSPVPATITGPSVLCQGSSIALADATSGGEWTSADATIATVGSLSGIVYATGPGVVDIYFYAWGYCAVSQAVTVNPLPATIGGPADVCLGSTSALTDATTGGTWVSSDLTVATIGSVTGIVSGVALGAVTIDYINSSTGCYISTTVNVVSYPAAISGPSAVCVGANITLTDATTGGAWSSSNTAIATANSSSGVVTGVAASTAIISYTSGGGCTVTTTVTVNPNPVITPGTTTLCMGAMATLNATPSGGTWSSANTMYGTVDPGTGVFTAVLSGTVTVSYTLSTGCYATVVMTIPGPDPIGPISYVCIGGTTTLNCTPSGGTWASSTTTVAVIDPGSGAVTSVSAGTTTISYSAIVDGCMGTAIMTFTVEPLPVMYPNLAIAFCSGATLTAGGIDPTYTYTWAPAATLSASTGASVTCMVPPPSSPGFSVYTITATSIYGCTSTALDTVVLIQCGNAQICGQLGSPITAITGDIGCNACTTVFPPGSYYAWGNINFHGTVVLNGAIVAIAPLVTMSVTPTAELIMGRSHLFCCSPNMMWNGIVLGSDLAQFSGECVIQNSLIEDATVAVSISDGIMPYLANILSTDGAIFNRNQIGIAIARYPCAGTPSSPIPSNYPFSIQNTVFTSRDFTAYSDGSYYYPLVWPATDVTPTSLKMATGWTTNPMVAPYNIDNPNAGGTGVKYLAEPCKSPGVIAIAGITLRKAFKITYTIRGQQYS